MKITGNYLQQYQTSVIHKNTMYTKVILLVLCAFVQRSVGNVRCYTCSFSSQDSDRSCLTITDTTPTADCPYQYCTIMRQEYTDPAGEVVSFIRGCDDAPDFLNHDITDPFFRTYYRACTNDLCNIGDGIQSVVGGSLSPTPQRTGDNLLVPGTGGSGTMKFSFILMAFLLILVINV